MQALAADSDDFVALSTYSSNVVLLEAEGETSLITFIWIFLEVQYNCLSTQ